ncbi:MAG TPA: SRPBCC family protein [Candidatus Limnocylindrales bacterium]|nr:SRPBCC family protein [Candidatus Limnocylindrales bacterium]
MSRTTIDAPAGVPFIDVTREFDAPLELVWKAWTEPELIKQWLGPAKYEMVIHEWDVRDGGRWRFVHRAADGEFGFHGVFHGEPSPHGFLQTWEFEGAPGHVSLERLTLEERDGRTIARTHSSYQSVADRDAMIENGMEGGMNEGFDRLDQLLARLQPAAVH